MNMQQKLLDEQMSLQGDRANLMLIVSKLKISVHSKHPNFNNIQYFLECAMNELNDISDDDVYDSAFHHINFASKCIEKASKLRYQIVRD